MQEFIEEFKEEAGSIVGKVQENLILLEQDPTNISLVEEIFRGAHTLKGSSRMFGFESIEKVTHEIENIFDKIRDGDIVPNSMIISLSLKVFDTIVLILEDKADEKAIDNLITEIQSIDFYAEQSSKYYGVFHISYQPDKNIYERGIKPLLPLDEVRECGNCSIFEINQKSISLEKQEENRSFESIFDIIILSKKELSEIEDIFLFMLPEEYEITEVSDFDSDQFSKFLEKRASATPYTKDEIEQRINAFTGFINELNIQKEAIPNNDIESPKIEDVHDVSRKVKEEVISKFINVRVEKLEEMMDLVSDLVTLKAELSHYAETSKQKKISNMVETLERITNRFRDNAFSIRLVPLQILMLKFQRTIRELGESLGKPIQLITEGLHTEIDKSIINEIESPLMHIIRNAIDHGLESNEERIKAGKVETGTLKITAFYAGAQVFIQVQDDGRGIDLEKVRAKALKKGLISENQVLSSKELLELLFIPGFSTQEYTNELSGRGVGLDVVRKTINDLRGTIDITTEMGLGTAFTIRLPLSLSILDVLHIKVGKLDYLIPHAEVEQCVTERFNTGEFQKEGYNLNYKGRLFPHIDLRKEFGEAIVQDEKNSIVIVKKNEQFVSFEVDKIVKETQLVIKPVDEIFKSVNYLAGTAILGDGSLAFLIDSIRFIEIYGNKQEISK